ncbi:MAG: shikimate kinase [Alkalispirochaeta sp.]
MNLYLSGMIGSGKTTVGRELSARTKLHFVDLDQEMDGRLGYSFHQLVHERGWVPFRELEYSICKYFADLTDTIVCLGGGTIRYEWNRDAIAGTGPVVLLEAREETLIERVSIAERPRVHSDTDLAGDIRRMWREYGDRYRSSADHIISTDGRTLDEEIADLIAVIRNTPELARAIQS